MINDNDLSGAIWAEKYRPKTVNAIILPGRILDFAQGMVDRGEIQHCILAGPAGTGKTTLAKGMCEVLGVEYLVINASLDANIDTIRTTIQTFASSMSLSSPYKVIILDELGEGKSVAFQPALKSFMETFHENCRFVITTNHLNKILPPIKSRCAVLEFNFSKEEKKELILQYHSRLRDILATENVHYDKAVLAAILKRYFPDFRKVLVELQKFSQTGTLSDSAVASLHSDSIGDLYSYLRDGSRWNDMRKWVVDNLDSDASSIIRAVYDKAPEYVKPDTFPHLVLFCAQYAEKLTTGIDPEITLVAFFTEVMTNCEFK